MELKRLKIMNKKGFEFKSAFYAIIIMSMVLIAVGVIVGNWGEQYNSGINYDLEEYNQLDSISSEAQYQEGQITPQDSDIGTGDFEGRIFRGGYGILGNIFSPFRSIFNMLESIETKFGLPSYVMEGVITMMFFALITAIIAVIFRLNRSNA